MRPALQASCRRNSGQPSAVSRPFSVNRASQTEGRCYSSDVKDQFQYTGPFLLWKPSLTSETPNTTAIRKSLAGLQPDDFNGPWASESDRSPIRGLYIKHIAKNITQAAIIYSEEMIKARKFEEAERMLNWAEAFENRTELGPVFTEEIAQLKKEAIER